MKLKEKNKAFENFIMQGDTALGDMIDIKGGECDLIKEGLLNKSYKELLEMLVKVKKISYTEAEKLKKEQIVEELFNMAR